MTMQRLAFLIVKLYLSLVFFNMFNIGFSSALYTVGKTVFISAGRISDNIYADTEM